MATLIAEIASYSVLFAHGNTPNQLPYRNRFIHLHLAPNANNLSVYILSFVPEARNASTGKLEKLPDNTYRGGTTIPVDEFSAYYELLRNEKSISIRLDFVGDLFDVTPDDPMPLSGFTFFTD
jgi:hypothetical protein